MRKLAAAALATTLALGAGAVTVSCDREDQQDVEEVVDDVEKAGKQVEDAVDDADSDGKDD